MHPFPSMCGWAFNVCAIWTSVGVPLLVCEPFTVLPTHTTKQWIFSIFRFSSYIKHLGWHFCSCSIFPFSLYILLFLFFSIYPFLRNALFDYKNFSTVFFPIWFIWFFFLYLFIQYNDTYIYLWKKIMAWEEKKCRNLYIIK